jgi:hypothetical protein
MFARRRLSVFGFIAFFPIATSIGQGQTAPSLPDVTQLIREVTEHQKSVDAVRENYTYSAIITIEGGAVTSTTTKTEIDEFNNFYVNGYLIQRTISKDGNILVGKKREQNDKEVANAVKRCEKLPHKEPNIEALGVSLSRLLDLVDVSNLRRDESFRSRPTFLIDFIGRKDAKALNEDERIVKALRGTLWIDEADREISHIEVVFNEDFHFGWGILGSFKKGSKVTVDQAPEADGLWLPVNYDFEITGKVLLVGRVAARGTERHYDFKRFNVESQQSKTVDIPSQKQP